MSTENLQLSGPTTTGPALSVVIRTFNSARTLGRVLERLDGRAGDEVVVVDSGSTDETLAIAGRYGARIIPSPRPFHYSRALNAGFEIARREWVLALSSHAVPAGSDLLAQYRAAAAESPPQVAAICGAAALFVPPRQPATTGRIFTADDFQRGTHGLTSNANCLYRRSAWERHRFDETISTAEDVEWSVWAYRAGHWLRTLPGATVLYRSRIGCRRMFAKGYRDGQAVVRLGAAPPLRLSSAALHALWLVACVARLRVPPGLALQRIFNLAGDYLGRRRSERTALSP